MEIEVTKTYKFDLVKERKRLHKCFKGKQLQRQLDLVQAFEDQDWKKFGKLYDALPECPKRECTEKEYVGMEISNFITAMVFRDFDQVIKVKNEQ